MQRCQGLEFLKEPHQGTLESVLVLVVFFFFFFLFWDQGPTKPTPNELKPRRRAHIEGRWGSSYAKDCHVINNNHKTPPRRTHRVHQTKDNPHATKTAQQNWATYLRCCFQFQAICKSFLLQRTFLAPHVWSKTLEHGRNGEVIDLNLLDHPSPRRLGVGDQFIPNRMFDLDSCHCSW